MGPKQILLCFRREQLLWMAYRLAVIFNPPPPPPFPKSFFFSMVLLNRIYGSRRSPQPPHPLPSPFDLNLNSKDLHPILAAGFCSGLWLEKSFFRDRIFIFEIQLKLFCIQLKEVCKVENLVGRLEVDKPSVCRRIVKLLAPSYFPSVGKPSYSSFFLNIYFY